MHKTRLTLTLDITSEWHIGSGQEGGAKADALVLKDQSGLPYLPGKALKGLLREAMQTATDNQWAEPEVLSIFGSEGAGLDSQSTLIVSSATLSDKEAHYFDNNPKSIQHLYRTISSTAIDSETGVAKSTSLRSMEVVVPMKLVAHLELIGEAQMYIKQLKAVTHLVTQLGAKRNRGLGHVFIDVTSIEEVA